MRYSAQMKGFYPDDYYAIPADAVEISDETYAALFKGQANGGQIVPGGDGYPVLHDPQPIISLDNLKRELKGRIDTAAEAERLKYITAGSGQAMTYSQKADEATRYLSATSPVATDYPMLNAEVGVTAETINEVATVVSNSFAQWQVIGAAIERMRLGAKKSIDASDTVGEANSVANAIVWPGA